MNHLCTRRLSVSLTIGMALLILVSNLASRAAAQATIGPNTIDRYVTEQVAAHNLPGLALAITHGDEAVLLRGYGVGHDGEPMTPQTQLFLASVSKSFTALAVMQLVEAGRIDLDAPVQTYLPDFSLRDPLAVQEITIRHLLYHTSGLADAGYPEGRLPQPSSWGELLASLSQARPVASPGTTFHYFNPNYQLLARVVEVVSGEPFSAYLKTHVFAPLQMTNTFSAITSPEAFQRAERLAQGHVMAFGVPVPVQEMSGFLGGSAGVVSTAEDMAKYVIMQNNEGRLDGTRLLSSAGMALMHRAPQTPDSDYAMGWLETTQNGTRLLEHSGILSAYYADVVFLPEFDVGIVLLYNASSLASNAVAAPSIKNGLVALVTGGRAEAGAVNLRGVGALLAVAALSGIALAIRSLQRLPQWRREAQQLPRWRLVLGILGILVPAGIWLALPGLITATSGRAFGYAPLFRSMPEVLIWLGGSAVLGLLNGALRVFYLARRSG